MKLLVINCGSSSLKYQVFDMNKEEVLAKGDIERIGDKTSKLKYENLSTKGGLGELVIEREVNDYKQGIELAIQFLTNEKHGVLKELNEIKAIGHRVVHGGEEFSDSVLIDEKVIKIIEKCSELAPLHNPPNLEGIMAARKIFEDKPQVGVFDTAFHQTMTEESYLYGLPYELYKRHGIRKYGFHGTSHKYVAERASQLMCADLVDLKLITCHLGNGASVTAIDSGKSIDTSMGFTPLEGLVMGTRCGSIDPAIVTYLMEKEGMEIKEIEKLLNEDSGVLGISGISNDFRDLKEAFESGELMASLALNVFIYTVVKFIGAYIMILGGVDGLVFTAGVGENSPYVRKEIINRMGFIGVRIDQKKNQVKGEEKELTAPGSPSRVFVIPTNEELMIARETMRLCN